MKGTPITVAAAARHFADCLSRVHDQHMSFVLLKNGKPVARLVPDAPKRCSGRDLAAALSTTELTAEESQAWHRDLRAARHTLQPPLDPWP